MHDNLKLMEDVVSVVTEESEKEKRSKMGKKTINKKAYRKAKREAELAMCKRSSEYLFGDMKKGILPF